MTRARAGAARNTRSVAAWPLERTAFAAGGLPLKRRRRPRRSRRFSPAEIASCRAICARVVARIPRRHATRRTFALSDFRRDSGGELIGAFLRWISGFFPDVRKKCADRMGLVWGVGLALVAGRCPRGQDMVAGANSFSEVRFASRDREQRTASPAHGMRRHPMSPSDSHDEPAPDAANARRATSVFAP